MDPDLPISMKAGDLFRIDREVLELRQRCEDLQKQVAAESQARRASEEKVVVLESRLAKLSHHERPRTIATPTEPMEAGQVSHPASVTWRREAGGNRCAGMAVRDDSGGILLANAADEDVNPRGLVLCMAPPPTSQEHDPNATAPASQHRGLKESTRGPPSVLATGTSGSPRDGEIPREALRRIHKCTVQWIACAVQWIA